MADCKENCDNNCAALDGLYEKAVNLIAYSNLINSWVNGPATGTVNVAGKNVPTLLNLATTLKSSSDTLITNTQNRADTVINNIQNSADTLLNTTQNRADTLITSLQNRINNVPLSIIQEGGGLFVDSNGKLYIDFNQMPTDKFEYLLKSLRLPVWLSSNKNFYVNRTTGSDTIVDGIGESSSKPFKNIQNCVDYVCDNYNIGQYQARIHIAAGTYNPVNLGSFTYTTGSIRLIPDGDVMIKKTDSGYVLNVSDGNWVIDPLQMLLEIDFGSLTGTPFFGNGCIYATGGKLEINGINAMINIIGDNTTGRKCNLELVNASENAQISIMPSSSTQKLIMAVENSTTNNFNYYGLRSGGTSIINLGDADGSVSGEITTQGRFTTFADVSNKGSIVKSSVFANQASFTTPSDRYVVGKRYNCVTGGTINTYGAGANYFPGDVAGTVESSTYSWYK